MENKRKALGKGLEQLFSNEMIDFNDFESNILENASKDEIININIDEIRSNPYQPRKTFEPQALEELASSIKEHGVISPIIVKKSIKGYELVAGERRTKASKLAGCKTIPAIVRNFDDVQMMEIALIENIQRENLTPMEEAFAYKNIIDQTGITQETLANKFGKSRSHITNMLGLLNLPQEVQVMVNEKKLSMSHARALSKINDEEQVIELAHKIVKENLNVRDIENILNVQDIPKRNKIKKSSTNLSYEPYQEILRDMIGTKVKINSKRIEIPFDSQKDLERILQILNVDINMKEF